MALETSEREPVGAAQLDARSFFVVLLCGAIGAAVAFFWTVSRHEAQPRGGAGGSFTPFWGQTPRQMLVMGRYEELAAQSASRRSHVSRDPEAWLFGGFAHEALAARPGLPALEHRVAADQIWAQLLERCERSARRPPGPETMPREAYYTGWALLGLGRPVMARERFGAFAAEQVDRGGGWLTDYNRACYLALAGEHDGAVSAWLDAMNGPRPAQARWSVIDPDLELIFPYLWENDLGFRVWSLIVEYERASPPERSRSLRPAEDRPVPRGEAPSRYERPSRDGRSPGLWR